MKTIKASGMLFSDIGYMSRKPFKPLPDNSVITIPILTEENAKKIGERLHNVLEGRYLWVR